MSAIPTKIILIHDSISNDDPLILALSAKYGKDNVTLITNGKEGLALIQQNLGSRIVVILDFDLGTGEPNGAEVLKSIREKTGLIAVIIMTAKELSSLQSDDIKKLVNNDASALVSATDEMSGIITKVDTALHNMDTRIDCVIEQWMLRRDPSEWDKPHLYLMGNTYSWRQLLDELRKQSDVGKKIEKYIIQLIVDNLLNGGADATNGHRQ